MRGCRQKKAQLVNGESYLTHYFYVCTCRVLNVVCSERAAHPVGLRPSRAAWRLRRPAARFPRGARRMYIYIRLSD